MTLVEYKIIIFIIFFIIVLFMYIYKLNNRITFLENKIKNEQFTSTSSTIDPEVLGLLQSVLSTTTPDGVFTVNNLHVTGNLTVDTATSLGGNSKINNLTINGTSTLNGNTTINKPTSINNDVTITGACNSKTLNCTGDAVLNNFHLRQDTLNPKDSGCRLGFSNTLDLLFLNDYNNKADIGIAIGSIAKIPCIVMTGYNSNSASAGKTCIAPPCGGVFVANAFMEAQCGAGDLDKSSFVTVNYPNNC